MPLSPPQIRSTDADLQRSVAPNEAASSAVVALVVAALGITGIAAVSMLGGGGLASEPAFRVATWFAAGCIAAVFVAAYRASGDALHPVCLAMVFMGLLFPFHGWVAHDNGSVITRLGADRYEYFTYALFVAGGGALAIYAGYRSPLAGRVARKAPRWTHAIDDLSEGLTAKLWLIWGVAMIARALLVADGMHFHYQDKIQGAGRLIAFQFLLTTLAQFASIAMLMFVGTGIVHRHRTRLTIGLGLLAIELAWGLISGSRLKLLLPLFLVAVFLGRVWKPVKLRTLVAGLLVFTFVVFPVTSAFRAAYFGRLDDVQREGLSVDVIAESLSETFSSDDAMKGPMAPTDDPVEMLAERMHGLTSLALIIRYTPERHPYLFGRDYVLLPVNILVPRFLWPGKPGIAKLKGDFKFVYWGAERHEQTSVAVTQLGDLWVNFHVAGTLFGSFLFGVALRFLYDMLRVGWGRGSVYPHVVYAMLLFPIIYGLSVVIDGFVAGTFKTFVVFWAVAWFLAPKAAIHRAAFAEAPSLRSS